MTEQRGGRSIGHRETSTERKDYRKEHERHEHPARLACAVPGQRHRECKGGDGLLLTCNVWRQTAENMAESPTHGMRVIVSGRLRQRNYQAQRTCEWHGTSRSIPLCH